MEATMTMAEELTGEELRAAQREEACARLRMLEEMGLDPSAGKAFGERGRIAFDGAADTVFGTVRLQCLLQDDFPRSRSGEPLMGRVRAFEERFGALVYLATREFTGFGEILDLFYVSQDADEWADDRRLLAERKAYVRACNLDDDAMSDIGVIGFEVSGGGIARTF